MKLWLCVLACVRACASLHALVASLRACAESNQMNIWHASHNFSADMRDRGVTRLEEFEALHTYRAHQGEVFATTVSYDGRYIYVTIRHYSSLLFTSCYSLTATSVNLKRTHAYLHEWYSKIIIIYFNKLIFYWFMPFLHVKICVFCRCRHARVDVVAAAAASNRGKSFWWLLIFLLLIFLVFSSSYFRLVFLYFLLSSSFSNNLSFFYELPFFVLFICLIHVTLSNSLPHAHDNEYIILFTRSHRMALFVVLFYLSSSCDS